MTSKNNKQNNQQDGPVTVSIARKVKIGFEKKYELWEKAVIKEVANFPGYIGTNFLRPNSATENKYIIIYRFDSYLNARKWEDSLERKKWLSDVEPFLDGEPIKQKVTGLEAWFELPEIEATKQAPRYKMGFVLTVVLYVLSLGLNLLLRPVLERFPWQLNILILLIINVLLMTYVVMPKVTYWLRNWLYK
jgi:antibiotic biosynthesis monooxygenase (ABM) superfamily enzyme